MNSNTMYLVVFLDVDGVLNTRRSCVHAPSGIYVGVDDAGIAILAKSMRENGAAGVVLTTTWKDLPEDDEDYIYLVESLAKYRIKVLGKTREDLSCERGEGILEYLDLHPEIDEFVILDDQHFDFEDHRKLYESFIDTQGRGIEYSVVASRTPSVAAILFLDSIKKFAKD